MTTKTKPETRKEAANSVTSLASSAPKRGKTLWVEMSIYPTERKGSFKLVNERALDKHGFKPVLGGYVSKMVLEHLRAAQPKITCEDCCEVRDYDKDMAKVRAEGMAQGKKEEREAFKASFGWAADVKYWLVKRAELEKGASK
jgi:hypothetical protein